MAVVLLVARGGAVAALLSAFGALAFGAAVLPRTLVKVPAELAAAVIRRVRIVASLSLVVALLAMPAWAALQALALEPPSDLGETLLAVPGLLLAVRFGQFALGGALACGLALLALHWPGLRSRWSLATCLAGLAVVLHAGHLHGFAMDGAGPLAGAEAVHLLAAGGWLGGLVPLGLVVGTAPPAVAAAACRWYSPLGKACVVAMVASAAWQGCVLVGSISGLVGTPYGWMVLAKMTLFGVLFGFAWVNRYHLAPALTSAHQGAARRALLTSLALQTGNGLLTVAVAIVLSSLQPAADEQPSESGRSALVRTVEAASANPPAPARPGRIPPIGPANPLIRWRQY